MMTEHTYSVAQMLRERHFETLRGDVRARAVAEVLVKCFDSEESALRSARLIQRADALMGKFVARSFEQRIEALEQKVNELETYQ